MTESTTEPTYATEDAILALKGELYDMNQPEESFAALTDEFANAKHLDGRRELAEAFIGSDWLRNQIATTRREALLPEYEFETYENDGRVTIDGYAGPDIIADSTSHRHKTVTISTSTERILTPAQARRFAAAVLKAADIAEEGC